MGTEENAAASVNEERDDLETITGIGPTISDALYGIGIRQFADLAQYTPHTLAKALREKAGRKISPKSIVTGNWLAQAKALAQQANTKPTPSEEGARVKKDPQEMLSRKTKAWEEHRAFWVHFEYKVNERGEPVVDERGERTWQIRVYDTQSGVEEPLPGLDPASWVKWILERAELPEAAISIPIETEIAHRAVSTARGDTVDEIKLQRGGREVTFKKVPDRFAVRLRQGRATSEMALESALGRPRIAVRHVDSVAPEKMEIFGVEDATELEETMDELREAPAGDVITHVYTLDDAPGGDVIPTGTMTIQFKPEVSKAKREEILAEFGLEILQEIDFLPDGYTVRLSAASTENPLKIAAKLQQRQEIEVAEPDLSFKVSLQYAPADVLYPKQWHLKNRGDQVGLVAGADVKAEEAWEYTRGKRSITICIVDDGFDLTHPEFDAPGKIVAPRDFGQGDFDPNPAFADDNHGTSCAGVALAEENGEGVVGLAPRCAFMPVRLAEYLSDNTIVDYFQYAMDNGADVISCSWHAGVWNFPLSVKVSGIIRKAATQGRNGKGCVILFAAGNQDRPLDGVKNGWISHQGFALHPDVIAVGASNSMDERATYSNYGPELTICAPSSGPPGRRIVTTDRRGIKGYTSEDYNYGFGGTSSATPLAAGLAALILSINGELTSAEVREMMKKTADKIDTENGQYDVDGHSPFYGHGRINAHKAIERVIETPSEQEGVELEILDVDISAVVPSPGVTASRLCAEVHFQIAGTAAERLTADRICFRIDVRNVSLEDKVSCLVASEQGQLQPHVSKYARQPQFLMPNPGRYELHSDVVLLLPSGEMRASHQGPTFKVVP